MSFFALKSPLSASDRIERRRLIVADSLALITLFAVTVLLAVSTNYLYQSYASHQTKLADRWLQRGVNRCLRLAVAQRLFATLQPAVR